MIMPCKECISFAICLSRAKFTENRNYSFGYIFEWGDNKCPYLNNLTLRTFNDFDMIELKQYFMEQKGIKPLIDVYN